MADQEFLASFGVEIDEGGVSRLQKILADNRELAQSLAEAFDTASESIRAFVTEISENLPSLFSGEGYGDVTERLFGGSGGLRIGLDLKQANKDLKAFISEAKKPIPMTANVSGIVSAGRTALESLRSWYANHPLSVDVVPNVTTGSGDDSGSGDDEDRETEDAGRETGRIPGTLPRMSAGGRFAQPTAVSAASAEHLPPDSSGQNASNADSTETESTSREDLKISADMLTGLSLYRESLESVSVFPTDVKGSMLPADGGNSAAGFLKATDFSSLISGLSAAIPAGSVTQNNQNVSAPVTINVRSAGADAEQVGQSIYNTAERYLLRTMKSAFA